jgi:hypothetical protein
MAIGEEFKTGGVDDGERGRRDNFDNFDNFDDFDGFDGFDDIAGTSRRRFLRAGALATGGLALGLGGMSGVAAQEGEVASLVFARDLLPAATFRIIGKLGDSTTTTVLANAGQPGANGLDNAEEYMGFVIGYAYPASPQVALLFTREDVVSGTFFPPSRGGRARFGTDLSVYNNDLNLIQVSVLPA